MTTFLRRVRAMGHRKGASEKGAALIEMALVMPFLLLLVVGIWTTARAYNVKNTMDHAVREAARYGATVDPWDAGTSPAAVRALVDGELGTAAIPPANIDTICIEQILQGNDGCDPGGGPEVTNAPSDQVVVKIVYPNYQLNFVFFSTTVDLQSTAIARWES